MIEVNELRLHRRWRLTATEKGTRVLGKPCTIAVPGERYRFKGRPILDLGNIAHVLEGENMIVTDGLELVTNMLIDTSAVYNIGLTYQAWGTDNTAVATSQADLVAEAARKVMTSRNISGVVGTFSTFVTAAEGNDNIKEAGVFGGSGAGGAGGSGIMFARWLVSFDNSGAGYDLTFDYVVTPSYS